MKLALNLQIVQYHFQLLGFLSIVILDEGDRLCAKTQNPETQL